MREAASLSLALRDEQGFERKEGDTGRALMSAAGDLWAAQSRSAVGTLCSRGTSRGPSKLPRWDLTWKKALGHHLWVWLAWGGGADARLTNFPGSPSLLPLSSPLQPQCLP